MTRSSTRPVVGADLLFGRLIATIRRPFFPSQKRFAEQARIPAGTLSRIEAGRNTASVLHAYQLDRFFRRNVQHFSEVGLLNLLYLAVKRCKVEEGWRVVVNLEDYDELRWVSPQRLDLVLSSLVGDLLGGKLLGDAELPSSSRSRYLDDDEPRFGGDPFADDEEPEG